MSVRHPELLWLLALLIIPVILYLLPLPRKHLITSTLDLWQRFLETERFGKASEKLRTAIGFVLFFLILLSLLLATIDLTAGHAAVKAKNLVVLLDTSASMNAITDEKTNFSRALTAAADLINTLDANTRVTLVESSPQLRVLAPAQAPSRELLRAVAQVESFDGAGDLRKTLQEAHRIWGSQDSTALYVFTDRPLPESSWGENAHAWVAPEPGDNPAIIALSATRKKSQITVNFTLANYGKTSRTLTCVLKANGSSEGSPVAVALGPGETAQRSMSFDSADETEVLVKLTPDAGGDALLCDDEARAVVPAIESRRVLVVWPPKGAKNTYIKDALLALVQDGVCEATEAATGPVGATIYVNHTPDKWPEGGAIAIYPLKSDLVEIKGLSGDDNLEISRQAEDPLLDGVDLRGMTVSNAVLTGLPAWGEGLVWAHEHPLIWDGTTGNTKLLMVGIPANPAQTRFPHLAAFPTLMRNALDWMLPQAEVLHPGETARNSITSRKIGFVKNPAKTDELHAFSLLSAAESDLRREAEVAVPKAAGMRSLAGILVGLALLLLPVEWYLFHKRMTE